MPTTYWYLKRACNEFDDDCGDSSNWLWGRWILFVVIIVGCILMWLAARFTNKRRGMEGRKALPGTAWMTPPSYFQSQRQYNQPAVNSGPSDATYVPPYSESPQEYDAGYFDADGVFHGNKGAQTNNPGISNPNVVGTSADGRPIITDDPTGTTPKPENVYHSPQAANVDQDFGFFLNGQRQNTTELQNLRPEGPPPPDLQHPGTSHSRT